MASTSLIEYKDIGKITFASICLNSTSDSRKYQNCTLSLPQVNLKFLVKIDLANEIITVISLRTIIASIQSTSYIVIVDNFL
tara:strand:- start:16575 stop:16820 length:246 start_codon:yes stop_codon:yes gene_type:complete